MRNFFSQFCGNIDNYFLNCMKTHLCQVNKSKKNVYVFFLIFYLFTRSCTASLALIIIAKLTDDCITTMIMMIITTMMITADELIAKKKKLWLTTILQ